MSCCFKAVYLLFAVVEFHCFIDYYKLIICSNLNYYWTMTIAYFIKAIYSYSHCFHIWFSTPSACSVNLLVWLFYLSTSIFLTPLLPIFLFLLPALFLRIYFSSFKSFSKTHVISNVFKKLNFSISLNMIEYLKLNFAASTIVNYIMY